VHVGYPPGARAIECVGGRYVGGRPGFGWGPLMGKYDAELVSSWTQGGHIS